MTASVQDFAVYKVLSYTPSHLSYYKIPQSKEYLTNNHQNTSQGLPQRRSQGAASPDGQRETSSEHNCEVEIVNPQASFAFHPLSDAEPRGKIQSVPDSRRDQIRR